MSCRKRQAVVTATTSKGYKQNTYNFCKECQNLHTFSPDFPGEYLIYENIPKVSIFLKTCMFLHSCHCLQRDIYTSPTYSSHSRYVYQVRLLNQLVDNCKNAVTFQQLETCQSCQFQYDKDFTTTMSYECLSHNFTLCLNCARLHRICPNDFSVATLDAVTSFVEKFKQKGLEQ